MIALLFILAAVVLAFVEAWKTKSFGWAALGCLFVGAFAVPAYVAVE